MRDKRNLHQKVQEMCDCFLTADPLKEMTQVKSEEDKEEAALKWLGLAILYGIDSNAKKIEIATSKDGFVKVRAKYRASELPAPGSEVGSKIVEAVRKIAHIEEEEGKSPLALGIRDSSFEIGLKVEEEDDCEVVTLKFPDFKEA